MAIATRSGGLNKKGQNYESGDLDFDQQALIEQIQDIDKYMLIDN